MARSIMDLIIILLDIPCFFFSVSFTFFVGYHLLRHREPYNSPYFRVFFVLSLVDASNYLWTLFTYRFDFWQPFVDFYLRQEFLPWFAYLMSGFWTYAQLFGHVLLSVNRAFAIMSPLSYDTLFNKRFVNFTILLIFLVPLPFLAPRLFLNVSYNFKEDKGIFIQFIGSSSGASICRSISAILTFATGTFCAFIESIACLYYVRYQKTQVVKKGTRVRQRLEVKICSESFISCDLPQNSLTLFNCDLTLFIYGFLAYATTMLTIQICLAVYQIILSYALIYNKPNLRSMFQKHFVWLCDVYSLSGPIFMFGSSDNIRRNYFQFYQNFFCSLFNRNYRPATPFTSEQRRRILSREPSASNSSSTSSNSLPHSMVLLKTTTMNCQKMQLLVEPVKLKICFDSIVENDVML